MRYFPNHGFINQPASIFESSEYVMPNTILACCYNDAGLEAWGLFTSDGDEIDMEEVSPYVAKVMLSEAIKQADAHFEEFESEICQYTEEMRNLPQED